MTAPAQAPATVAAVLEAAADLLATRQSRDAAGAIDIAVAGYPVLTETTRIRLTKNALGAVRRRAGLQRGDSLILWCFAHGRSQVVAALREAARADR